MPTTSTVVAHPAAAPEPVALGVDDGFCNTKIAGPNGVLYCIPSRARRGASQLLDLHGGELEQAEYRIGETTYTVGEVNGESTTFDEYPVSELNRVVVHHALYHAGFGGQSLRIATGLPIRMYYLGGSTEPNVELLRRKKANLESDAPVLVRPAASYENTDPVRIEKHMVTAEGLIAWYHLMVEEKGGKARFLKARQKLPFGFVDLGGRTADMAVVCDGVVDLARSGSINRGMLDVRDRLGAALQTEYGLTEVPARMLDSAMNKGRIALFGKEVDVRPLRDRILQEVAADIRDETRRRFGKGAELAEILFFGGAWHDFGKVIEADPWFPHQQAAEEPLYVNAIGMYKYARYFS